MVDKADIAMVAAKGLEELPRWAAVAVAVRAAWRALPKSYYDLSPEGLRDTAAAAVAVSGYLGLAEGKRDAPAVQAARSAARGSSLIEKQGLDAMLINGSGKEGRIPKQDVGP